MLAKGLLDYETLSGDDIKDLLNGTPSMREAVATTQVFSLGNKIKAGRCSAAIWRVGLIGFGHDLEQFCRDID